jgi:hypothetical protein
MLVNHAITIGSLGLISQEYPGFYAAPFVFKALRRDSHRSAALLGKKTP